MSNICEDTIRNLIELQQLEDQLVTTRTSKTEAQSQIDALRAKIIPNILGHHDRMRARGKKSVAEVRGSVCTGCHTTVATGILGTLRRMEDIQICANCGRYLFIVAAPPAPAPEPDAEPVRKAKKRKSKSSSPMV